MAKKEKLLVCDALDERDALRKKINNQIMSAQFVGSKRIKDNKVNGVKTKEEFESEATSTLQSIKDNIDRYNRLDVAITQANATVEIETRSGVKMTRAAAIALRRTISGDGSSDFDAMLIAVLSKQRDMAVTTVQALNKKADTETENYKMNLTGRDGNKKLSEDEVQMVEKLTADLYGELIDPIKVETELKTLVDKHDALVKELDSAIKVSNATTYVEF